MDVATFATLLAIASAAYAYALYPAILWLLARTRGPTDLPPKNPDEWPHISITVPVYNEAAQMTELLDSLLALDYPADRRQILVVSDASSDGTDAIVERYTDRGVELIRQPVRRGKTAAENAVRNRLRGEIVINTDASVRIARDALKPLVRRLAEPSVGVASGRDVSIARSLDPNAGEAGYVGYEMWVRSLETRVAGIVGASGCFYGIRRTLHDHALPEALSRDFAAPLVARLHGFRSVSVEDAVCYVPRAGSLRREYRRKVRTMTRGIETLWHMRALLDPRRFGAFAWMLASHKVARWLTPWFALAAVAALLVGSGPLVRAGLGVLVAAALGVTAIAWTRPDERAVPRLVSMPAFLVAGNLAVVHATLRALRGDENPVWEPTRRNLPAVETST